MSLFDMVELSLDQVIAPVPWRVHSLDQGAWRAAGCVLTGPGHHAQGRPCDDAFAWKTAGPWIVACVADGAGSARHGGRGAALATQVVCERVAAFLAVEMAGDVSWPKVEDAVAAAIGGAREVATRDAAGRGANLQDYHATLVGLVARGRAAILFHIGDGAAITRANDGAVVVSRPENGEYSNETLFYTLPRWSAHLRFTRIDAFDGAALMTDGVTPFALDRARENLAAGFIDPVFNTLAAIEPAQGARALCALLARKDIRTACDDDKTMVWIAARAEDVTDLPSAREELHHTIADFVPRRAVNRAGMSP